jgi:hypothetical protein
MTSNNALTLGLLLDRLDDVVSLARDADEVRKQLRESISRNRLRPDMLSDAYVIALRQKLTRLAGKYGAASTAAEIAANLASNLES